MVLGLPRGGVPVAAEVAAVLGAPLDVVVVRKLGAPFQPELGMGAIGEGGVRVIDQELLRLTGATPEQLAQVERGERAELDRRSRRYRGDRRPTDLDGRTALVVDDGVATGSTARAACLVARERGASRVLLAVPVGPGDAAARLGSAADEVVCLDTPGYFPGVGAFYDDFEQTTDEEVVGCLERAAAARARPGPRPGPGPG